MSGEERSGFLVPEALRTEILRTALETTLAPFDPNAPKPPPLPWRTRMRGKIEDRITDWRVRTARRAYKVIAGDWPDDGEDDW